MADEKVVNTELTPEIVDLLKRSGDSNKAVSLPAMAELAKAIELPLREGIMAGPVFEDVFEAYPLAPGASNDWPLHFLTPGTEKDYVAYTIPSHGRLPDRKIEGDYVTIPTYEIGAAIDWNAKYQRDAKWPVVEAARDNLNSQFTKKLNDDKAHVIISAGFDRNIMVFDSDAGVSQFTKRLVSLMKLVMARNGGGNSSSINKFELTDLYLSLEGMEDIRNWNVDQIDEVTRREIFTSPDGALNRIYSVNLRPLHELGENQEYQLFYNQNLGGALPTGDAEIVIGLDLSRSRSFVMPVRENLTIEADDSRRRSREVGLFGHMEFGLGVMDNRALILGSF